jgi:soluble lytic murein transglycosylase-like protein
MSKLILGYIAYYSSLYGVDPNLVKAVIQVESRGSPSLVGEAGEVGLMQLLPSSFPSMVGKLGDTKTNLRIGIRYLSKMKSDCVHQEDYAWIVCYNAGLTGGRKIKSPKSFPYYIRVMREYERLRDVESLPVQDGVGKR